MPIKPLVPVVVTDVNGRVTTVYRKPGVITSSAQELPPPVLSDPAGSVANRMAQLLDLGDRSRHDLRNGMRNQSPEFMRWLSPVLAQGDELSLGLATLVYRGASETLTRDVELFYRLTRESCSDIPFSDFSSLVSNLHRYKRFDDVVEFHAADDNVQAKCVALLTVAAELNKESWEMKHVARGRLIDESLVSLVLERPYDASVIVEVVREHRVADGATVRGLLDGIPPSLSHGAL